MDNLDKRTKEVRDLGQQRAARITYDIPLTRQQIDDLIGLVSRHGTGSNEDDNILLLILDSPFGDIQIKE